MYIDEITKYSNDLTPEEKIIGFLFYVTSSRENVLSRLEDYMFYNPVCKEIFQECKKQYKDKRDFTIISIIKSFRGKYSSKQIIEIGEKIMYGDSVDEVILLVKEIYNSKSQMKIYEKAMNNLIHDVDSFEVSDNVINQIKSLENKIVEESIESFAEDVKSFITQ